MTRCTNLRDVPRVHISEITTATYGAQEVVEVLFEASRIDCISLVDYCAHVFTPHETVDGAPSPTLRPSNDFDIENNMDAPDYIY